MSKFLSVFRDRKLLRMIGVSVLILIFFRVGASVTIPGIDTSKLGVNSGASSQNFISMLNTLGGGGLKQFSLFSLGVSPYITASIIVQLLSADIIKPLARWSKGGEKGRKKIDITTRILTLPFAILQSFAILNLLNTMQVISLASLPDVMWFYYITIMVAGCYVSLFLADIIGKFGIGNGISLIIFAGIVANLFSDFFVVYSSLTIGISGVNGVFLSILNFMSYILLYLFLVVIVVFINGSTRKIPIQQVGSGLASRSEEMTFLPIKVNPAGVIPVIFSSSILTIPITIAQFLPDTSLSKAVINEFFTFQSWVGLSIYFVLTFAFTFFYAFVQVNPNRLADNFKKNGSFIPGIKPGEETEKYIGKVLLRITLVGATFLSLVAALPYIVNIFTKIPSSSSLGGTGIIILIQVSLDWQRNIDTRLTKSEYARIRKSIDAETKSPHSEDKIDWNNLNSRKTKRKSRTKDNGSVSLW